MKTPDEILNKQIENYSLLWHRIFDTAIYKKFTKEYTQLNQLNPSEITIIHEAVQNPNLVLKDIVKILDLPKSTLTSMINRLEKKDYLKRIPCEEDKRYYRLFVTDKGKEIERQHLEMEHYVYGQILMGLDSDLKREQFLSLMEEIIVHFENETK